MLYRECAQPNQRMLQPSGFLIHCGASFSVAGMARWDCDQRLQKLSRLERVATEWDGVMSPCVQIESVASASQEPVSDSIRHCESETFGF